MNTNVGTVGGRGKMVAAVILVLIFVVPIVWYFVSQDKPDASAPVPLPSASSAPKAGEKQTVLPPLPLGPEEMEVIENRAYEATTILANPNLSGDEKNAQTLGWAVEPLVVNPAGAAENQGDVPAVEVKKYLYMDFSRTEVQVTAITGDSTEDFFYTFARGEDTWIISDVTTSTCLTQKSCEFDMDIRGQLPDDAS